MSEPSHTWDLVPFVEMLRRSGLRVDARQYLAANELLLAAAAHGKRLEDDPEALVRHLGPLIATTPDEQKRFAQLATEWFATRAPHTAEAPSASVRSSAWAAFRARRRAFASAGVLALSCLAVAAWAFLASRPVVRTGRVLAVDGSAIRPARGATVSAEPIATVTTDDEGVFTLSLRPGTSVLVRVELEGFSPAAQAMTADDGAPFEVTLERPAPQLAEPPPVTEQLFLEGPREFTPAPPRARHRERQLVVLQHQESVTSAAWDSSGARVVTASLDGTADLWDRRTGKRLMLLPHDDRVGSVSFSADGSLVVTASEDGSAAIWELATGARRPALQHARRLMTVALSPDATRALTASQDWTAALWDTATGKLLHVLQHQNSVQSAEFSADGLRVLTASLDKTAALWDAQTGAQLKVFSHDGRLQRARFDRSGGKIVTASWDGTATVWDAQTARRLSSLEHRDAVTNAAFSPSGLQVVTASRDGTAAIWSVAGERIVTLPHQGSVSSATFSADGTRVVTASADGTAVLWHAATGARLAVFAHDAEVMTAAFSADGSAVLTASADKTATVWDATPAAAPRPGSLYTRAAAAFVATFASLLAGLMIAAVLRRRLVLRRLPLENRDELVDLPSPPLPPVDERDTRRLVAALRRTHAQVDREIDAAASAEASARNGGFPATVFGLRRTVPEHLVLSEYRGHGDHQARLLDTLIEQLRGQGLIADHYVFNEDPRTCSEAGSPARTHSLGELLARHQGATLFFFSEAGRCFDRIDGRLEPWVELLGHFPRRVLFTPEPPFHWTSRERALAAAGWVVLPAGEEGLAAFAAIEADWQLDRGFPASYARPFPPSLMRDPGRWLSPVSPGRDALTRLLRELRGYLGEEGLGWLSACAVYPELAWSMTLELAPSQPPAWVREKLAALARLPWFREGFMPEWLRRGLIATMSEGQERAVRARLLARLEVQAQRALQLRQVSAADRLALGSWIGPLDLLRTAPEGSPLAEGIFVGFVAGARLDAPELEAPGAVARLFRRLGVLPSRDVDEEGARAARPWWRDGLSRFRSLTTFRPRLVGVALSLAAASLAGAAVVIPALKAGPVAIAEEERRESHEVLAAALDHGGQWVAAVARDGVTIWSQASGESASVTRLDLPAARAARFSAQDDRLWVAAGRELIAIETTTWKPIQRIETGRALSGLEVCGEQLLVLHERGVELRDALTGALVSALHSGGVRASSCAPERGFVIVTTEGQLVLRGQKGAPAKLLKTSGLPPTALEEVLSARSAATPPLVCTPELVERLSSAELRRLRNFVFARHGRAFSDEDLRLLFASTSWYRADPDYSDARLTADDEACLEAVVAAEPGARTSEPKLAVRFWTSAGREKGVVIALTDEDRLRLFSADERAGAFTELVSTGTVLAGRDVADFDGQLSGLATLHGSRVLLWKLTTERRDAEPPVEGPTDLIDASNACSGAPLAIQFEADSLQVPSSSSALLTDFASCVKANLEQRARPDAGSAPERPLKLLVAGHTSGEGSEELQLLAGQRMARAMSTRLAELGLEVRIDTVSRGNSQPICVGSEDCVARSRRVEVSCEDCVSAPWLRPAPVAKPQVHVERPVVPAPVPRPLTWDEYAEREALKMLRGDAGAEAASAPVVGVPTPPLDRERIFPVVLEPTAPRFDSDVVTRFVRSRQTAIRSCYERALKLDPTMRGRAVVQLTVTTSGRTSDVSIEGSSLSTELEDCIRRTVSSWVFPVKPEEDQSFSFPFVFSPSN